MSHAPTLSDALAGAEAEKLLRDSENYLRELIASLPGIIWSARPDGYCEYLSPQWYEFTGSRIGENLGDTWTAPLHPEDQGRASEAWKNAVTERCIYDIEYRIRRHDGVYRWFKVRGRPVRDSSGNIVRWFGTCTDIDAQRRAAERLGLLSDISSRLLAADEPQEIIDYLCHEILRHLDAQFFFNYLADDAAGVLRLNACQGISDELRPRMETLAYGTAVCGCVARDGNMSHRVAVQDDTAVETQFIRSIGVRAYCCHPLISQGRLIGTLSFGASNRDRFSDEDVSLMRAVSDQVAMAMQRMLLLKEMRRQKDEAEAASHAKDHFLATLSHELRTPLNPIMLVASALVKRADLAPDLLQDLEVIRTSAQLEARLVDDLLDLTRITRGKIDLQLDQVHVHQAVRYTIDACAAELPAERKPLILTDLRAEQDTVLADPARLSQVLWNLLRNAVKFTPHTGTITVRTANTDGAICIEVIDTGIGIDPEILPRIFDAFDQGSPMVTRQFGGLGLGLTIAQALVKLHGGTLSAHSAGRGEGATFSIRLPLHVPLAAAQEPDDSDPGVAGPRHVVESVLLVEDHVPTAAVLKRILAAEGFAVEHAATVKAALELARDRSFDLVISDIGLPDGTGRDLLPLLRDRKIPAIAVSGFGMESDLDLSREAGFVAHLVKPITIDALLGALKRVR